MKRSLAFALSFVLIIGVTAVAIYEGPPPVREDYWDNLPENWRFNFTTFGEFGASKRDNANFQIAGFIFTQKSAKRFYKENWPEPKDWALRVVEEFSNPLYVYVYSYGDSTEPFDPNNFSFSQGSADYSLTSDKISGFDSDREIMTGFLEVPPEIDLRETFYIHYKYGSAKAYTPGAFSFTESPYPEEEEKTKETEETEEETSEESEYGNREEVYDFEKSSSEYALTWNTGRASVNVAEGKLRLMADKGSFNGTLKLPDPFRPTLFDIRVKGEILEGDGAFGIVFGAGEEWRNYYDFLIDPKRNSYLWSHLSEGTFEQESEWKRKPSIIDEGTNRLRVERSGENYFNFYINGHKVETLKLSSYEESGSFGFVVNAFNESTIAGFEYFKME